MIPGLSTIKAWGVAILGVLAAIFFGLFQHQRAKRKGEQLNRVKTARETEKKATDALVGGLTKEQQALENAKIKVGKSKRRDHFES